MPNKKLHQRLLDRKIRVEKLNAKNPVIGAYALGCLAYKTIKGSYGNYLNPFDAKPRPKYQSNAFRDFKFGFLNMKRELNPKPIITTE